MLSNNTPFFAHCLKWKKINIERKKIEIKKKQKYYFRKNTDILKQLLNDRGRTIRHASKS